MNHSGKYKYLQGAQNEKEGEGEKRRMWAEAGVTSKALRMRCVCLLYARSVVRACRRCLAFSVWHL